MDDFARELGPTVDELVEIARAAGDEMASRSTINRWVSKGWISRPRQKARKWHYPNIAIAQADTIARLRARAVHRDYFRFALHVEAGTGEHEETRAFLLEYLALWKAGVDEHAARLADDPDALRAEAEAAARMRGKNAPLPHRVRVSLDERTLAMMFTLGNLFGGQLSAAEVEQGQHQLERLAGLRGGRGGATRDLTGIALSPGDWPTDAGELARAVQSATHERLEMSRRMLELAVVWFPALRSLFAGIFGPAASVALVDVIEEWEQVLTPEIYALLFAIGVKNATDRATDADVQETLAQLQPTAFVAFMLDDLPPTERHVVIRRLRPYPKLLVARDGE